ncbi:unnamed protein product [Caenorhabditis angaria]|uniref:Uncharacterized protein n=1 Tax=Caenorhabditis angaria TaxID=860376 RepID=A0A9P1J146_9PELO|nr:unnamed protein product [Caenorhabditis angaria]
MIPQESIGIPRRVLQNLPRETPPVFIETTKNIEVQTNKFVQKTSKIVSENKLLKDFASLFTGCQLNQIMFTPPTANSDRTIISPELRCSKKSIAGCQTAHVSCIIPDKSKYPLTSGFAKINGADWATTNLVQSIAEFDLECDIYNRWTYISDIPGMIGEVFPTNEIFCLLVPIISESNAGDFEEVNN